MVGWATGVVRFARQRLAEVRMLSVATGLGCGGEMQAGHGLEAEGLSIGTEVDGGGQAQASSAAQFPRQVESR